MILQDSTEAMLEAITIASVISAIIIFIPGIFITRWLAKRSGWDDSYKPAVILNVIWLIVNIAIGWFFFLIVALIINIIIGGFIASKLYKQGYGESYSFCIKALIILFIIWIILTLIIGLMMYAPDPTETTEGPPVGEAP